MLFDGWLDGCRVVTEITVKAHKMSGSHRYGYMLPLDSSMPGGQVWLSRVICRIVDAFSLEQHSPQVCSVSTSRHKLLRPSRRRTPNSSSSAPSLAIPHKSAHWFPCSLTFNPPLRILSKV